VDGLAHWACAIRRVEARVSSIEGRISFLEKKFTAVQRVGMENVSNQPDGFPFVKLAETVSEVQMTAAGVVECSKQLASKADL